MVVADDELTLSKMAVQIVVLFWLVMTSPTNTLADMETVAVPTRIQLTPSAER